MDRWTGEPEADDGGRRVRRSTGRRSRTGRRGPPRRTITSSVPGAGAAAAAGDATVPAGAWQRRTVRWAVRGHAARRRLSGPVLPDDRDRLRERRSAHRARVREDRRRRHRAVSPPARRRRLLPHGHRRARAEGRAGRRRARRVAAGSSSTKSPARFEAMWRRLVDLVRSASCGRRTTSHKRGVRALIKRIHDRTPDDFYEKAYEGWYCVGCELFKRDDEIVDGQCVLHPTRELEWTTERNWFFRLTRYEEFLHAAVRRASGVPPARDATQRDARAARAGTRGHLDHAVALVVGDSLPAPALDRRDAGDVGLVRRAAELPHGDRLSRRRATTTRWPAQLHVIGKDITRLHCVDLAGDARRPPSCRCPSACGRTASCCFGGERFSKSAGVRLDLDEAIDRFGADALRYFLLREVAVRRRRQLLVRAVRRALQRRPRERARQPGEPRDLDGREVLRRRRAERARDATLDRADAADLAEYHAAMDGSRGFLLHEGAQARDGVRRARQRVRAVAGSRGRSRRIPSRAASSSACSPRSSDSSRATRFISRRSCRTRRRSCGRSSAVRDGSRISGSTTVASST